LVDTIQNIASMFDFSYEIPLSCLDGYYFSKIISTAQTFA
jgi:hypothetical protein